MKNALLFVLLAILCGCNSVSPTEARQIAYERLTEFGDGPSLRGEALRSALRVTEHGDGKYLVELTDESRNLLWAVIVSPSGQSEITRMAIDG